MEQRSCFYIIKRITHSLLFHHLFVEDAFKQTREPLLIGNILFQSAPTGNSRSNVALFYKVLSNAPTEYTPAKLASGWEKIAVSDRESAYSSMCILPDKESIGFFYEEAPGGYSLVYVPLKLKEILPENIYKTLPKPKHR